MATGISTVDRSSRNPECLSANAIEFVIRYYSETTRIPTKVITVAEAETLSAAGIRIGAVYQDRQNRVGDFSSAAGSRDGHYAFAYARSLGQPLDTAIFFAVDYDASNTDISGPISRYFRAVAAAFAEAGREIGTYRIGIYGSGLTCRRLSEAGLAELTWLAQATGWRESSTYDDWNCKQGFDRDLCDLTSFEPCQTQGATNWLFSVPTDGRPAGDFREVDDDDLPLLHRGSEGPEVFLLRELLNLWLRSEDAVLLTAGEIFDDRTDRAVRAFQSKNVDNFGDPLLVDGLVGGLTWGALLRNARGEDPPRMTPLALDADGNPDPAWSTSLPDSGLGGTRRGRNALEVAVSELNANAREIGGDNRGAFVRKYLNGIVDEGSDWCAGFVSWCFSESGDMPFTYSVGARDIRNQLRSLGMTYDDPLETSPEPGDLVIWWRRSPRGWRGHIGFVHHASHGRLYTIEGNKTGHVQGFSYPLASMDRLLGFARVP